MESSWSKSATGSHPIAFNLLKSVAYLKSWPGLSSTNSKRFSPKSSKCSNFFANSDYFEFIESVLITNTHASDSVTIDLYEFKGQRIISSNESSSDTADLGGDTEGLRTAIVNPDEDIASDSNINYSKPLSELNVIGDLTFYILKSVKIPKGASLLLDSNDLSYKNAPDNGTLFIKLDQSDSQVTVRTIEKLK